MIYEPKYEIELESKLNKIIKVIGVGGAGCNAIFNMYSNGMRDVDFIACNTDLQALNRFPDEIIKLQLGPLLTKGLGAGTKAEVGREAALESEQATKDMLGSPTEMVFITAGMGGGTGTGAAPEIARIAKELGLLTIGVVTNPFNHEGTFKLNQASDGISKLKEHCDTVLIIKNDRLAEMYADLPIKEAYRKADDVLASGVRSIAELITRPGVINLDFADVRFVLGEAGHAVMGTAEASGPERAFHAIEDALNSPLLENNDISGAKRILVSMAYSDEKPEYEIKMSDQTQIMNFVETKIRSQAEIFKHGYAIDNSLGDKIRVTIVAAQFTKKSIIEETGNVIKKKKELVGGGIGTLIPEKPRKRKPVEDPNQINIFESENKLEKVFKNFMENEINYTELANNPTYERMEVNLDDEATIEASNPGRIKLKDLYDIYVSENLMV